MSAVAPKDPAAQAQDANVILPLSHIPNKPKAYRLEIDEFLADNARANLFLLALSEMQKNSIKFADNGKMNWWSFYSIAAIHGLPMESWAGSKNTEEPFGYCHHSVNTFPTWHRPYMFQMEQAIYNQMVLKANEFKDKHQQLYLDAASRFRLPYWDIAMPRNKTDEKATETAKKPKDWQWGLPEILKREQVYVRTPDKPEELQPIPNPLYKFTFPKAEEYKGVQGRPQIPWLNTGLAWRRDKQGKKVLRDDVGNLFDHTVRAPRKLDREADYNFLEKAIQLQTRAITVSLWQLLNPEQPLGKPGSADELDKGNDLRSWDEFAKSIGVGAGGLRSIEAWHDRIHVLVGSGDGYSGHMVDPSIAAFDPLFWLHHNNIERMLCIYQVLWPDKYVSPGKRADQNPFPPANVPDLFADDELQPFTKDGKTGKCFTSTEVRDWTKSGFAVPGDRNDGETTRKAVAQYLRDTYYWATDANKGPPSTLLYPKDQGNVEALTGKLALEQLPLQIEAISVHEGTPQLVKRAIAIKSGAIAEEQAINPDIVANIIKEGEQEFPLGALIDVNEETDTKMNTWNVHLQVKKYTYDCSFKIHFFVGSIEGATVAKFMTRKNEAGFTGIFAQSERSECEICEKNRDRGGMYQDVVPLTNILLDYLKDVPGSGDLISGEGKTTINDLSAAEVVPFLKENLRWKITDTSAELLPYLPESELEIKVMQRIFIPPQGDNLLGNYGPSTLYPEITAGKDGGYSGPA